MLLVIVTYCDSNLLDNVQFIFKDCNSYKVTGKTICKISKFRKKTIA